MRARLNTPWVAIAIGKVPRQILVVPVAYYRVPPGHLKHKGWPLPAGSGEEGPLLTSDCDSAARPSREPPPDFRAWTLLSGSTHSGRPRNTKASSPLLHGLWPWLAFTPPAPTAWLSGRRGASSCDIHWLPHARVVPATTRERAAVIAPVDVTFFAIRERIREHGRQKEIDAGRRAHNASVQRNAHLGSSTISGACSMATRRLPQVAPLAQSGSVSRPTRYETHGYEQAKGTRRRQENR